MGTANMKVLLLFGLVAVALADITRFEGEKVFRLKPVRDEHVTLIKELAKSIEVDFWRPDAAELVTIDIDVDIHVPAKYLDMVHTILQQNDMEHEVLIEDLQDAIDSQADNKPSPRAHSYTKYNTWNTVQSWIASISSSNPSLISKQVIGSTYEGRPMTVLKLSKKSSSTKPAIFMDCGIHAREWISPAFCQWFVKEALSTYGSDSQMTSLLNQMDVFVLPVFNIDGYDFTHKSNRMWRKTRSRSPDTAALEPIPTGTGTLAGAPLEPPATPAVTSTVDPNLSLRLRSRMLQISSAGTSPSSKPTSPSTPTPSCCSSPTPTPLTWPQTTVS